MTLGPEHWCPLVGDVEIQGPVAGGHHGWPFGASVEDLAVLGYVEEEYFVTGTAPTYALATDSAYTRDGRWSAERLPRPPVRQVDSDSHELADKDACCCGVRWTTFFGLQFHMDWVGRVIALS